MIQYPDAHTHRRSALLPLTLRSLHLDEVSEIDPRGRYSVGVHPWKMSDEFSFDERQFEALLSLPGVVAVGECGIDRLRGVSMETQLEVFEAQIRMADAMGLPVVMHNVRAQAEFMTLAARYPAVRFVWHGFRGGVEMAHQLLRRGVILSFGVRYNEAALREVPLESLLLESDESEDEALALLYRQAAVCRGVSTAELADAMSRNMQTLFRI